MYVKHIKGAVKGEHAATLGQHVTCIHGPSRSGKSALLNLLTLAYDGSAEEMSGRGIVREPAALLGLGDGGPIWSEGTLSDGRVSSFRLEPGGRPKPKGPRGIFVVRDVYEALTGGAGPARAYLLQQGANVTFDGVLGKLDASLHDTFTLMAGGIHDPVDALVQVRKAALKRARAATAERKGALLAQGGGAPSVPVADEALVALRNELDAAKEDVFAYTQSVQAAQAGTERETLMQQRMALADALGALSAEIDVEPPQDTSRADNILAALQALAKVYRGIDFAACLACGQPVESDAWWQYASDMVDALPIQTEDERVAVLHQGLKKLNELESQIARLPDPVEVGEAPDVDVPAVQARYDNLVAQRAAWVEAQNGRAAVEQLDGEIARLKFLADALGRLEERFVDDALALFCTRVSARLPPGDEFGIELKSNKARIGLRQDNGSLRTWMSGSEEVSVFLALAVECAPQDHDGPVIAIAPDRAWDPKALRNALQALGKTPVQVIITSTVKPGGRKLANVHYIETAHDE